MSIDGRRIWGRKDGVWGGLFLFKFSGPVAKVGYFKSYLGVSSECVRRPVIS